ncbi:Transcription initiation factor TFIID subunit 4b [Vitis vinifera]|uniref:Transcription initiation factor TFIID subunit 4b n=1 Tax=Vitis vinifera TaxID=29760 RepID=A0A438GJK6_VITVI|nr:Transcription initiation factor TFIID subunit 4b [Vitis vinifera]
MKKIWLGIMPNMSIGQLDVYSLTNEDPDSNMTGLIRFIGVCVPSPIYSMKACYSKSLLVPKILKWIGQRPPSYSYQAPISAIQFQSDSSASTRESYAKDFTEVEHPSGLQRMQIHQTCPASLITVNKERKLPADPFRGLNKQQQVNIAQISSLTTSREVGSQEHRSDAPEPVDKTAAPLQLSASLGSSSLGAVQAGQQDERTPETSQCKSSLGHPRAVLAADASIVPTSSATHSMTLKLDSTFLTSSAATSFGATANANRTLKRPLGQEKPIQAFLTPLPSSSKRIKVTATSPTPIIEELNDVTAISEINLREEEEHLFSGEKEECQASKPVPRVIEQEKRLTLQKSALQKKLARIISKCGIGSMSNDVESCLSLSVEEIMQGLIRNMIRLSKQRVDFEKTRHHAIITTDVQNKILMMNLKVKDDLKLHKAEGERRANEMKRLTDSRMQRKAANVAARVAVGGDDLTLRWQVMAKKAQQKSDGAFGKSFVVQQSKDMKHMRSPTSGRRVGDSQELHAKGTKSRVGENQSARPQSKVVRSVSIKDLLATLEREPQMAKSALTQRLRERIHSDGTAN